MIVTPPELEQTAIGSATWLPGYELLGIVGAGGHGQVFKARQLVLDRIVAVKLVSLDTTALSDPATRFEREAVALGRFHHPNIVPVFDFGRHDDRLYMAMELLEGEDLGSRVRRAGKLDEKILWLIVRQAAAGLAHAAAHGVIHRDVKPANLFLLPAPTGVGLPDGVPMVKVMDFGLAQAKWACGPAVEQQTAKGMIVGTPAYMAPEQHRGGDVDLRADIYALGATAYHALTGCAPFTGRSIWEIMARKVEAQPPSYAAIPAESTELIQAMMTADPKDRIQSYCELIARIDRLLDPRGRAVKRALRRFRMVGPQIAAALGVAAAISIGIAITRDPPAQAKSPPLAEYVSSGRIESLFDGVSLDHWSSSGAWSMAKDDEHVPILSGSGLIRRPFAAEDSYRVTIGLDSFEASATEIQFAIPVGKGRRGVLRVSRTAGAVLGTREGERARFIAAGAPIAFPSPNWFKGRRPYLEIRIERAGAEWLAWFRGELAGRVPDDGIAKQPEIRILAEDGRARIDSIVLEQLKPRAD